MSDDAATTGKPLFTPFNVVAGIIVVLGLIVTVIRFTVGLDAVTNLSDYNPWGIWIGFDLLVGVALAAGGYVTSAAGRDCTPLRRGPALATAVPVYRAAGNHFAVV